MHSGGDDDDVCGKGEWVVDTGRQTQEPVQAHMCRENEASESKREQLTKTGRGHVKETRKAEERQAEPEARERT